MLNDLVALVLLTPDPSLKRAVCSKAGRVRNKTYSRSKGGRVRNQGTHPQPLSKKRGVPEGRGELAIFPNFFQNISNVIKLRIPDS